MNLAYLDPPYSRYFHKLAASLARQTGGKTLALLSSPAYRRYTGGDPQALWTPGDADPRYRIPEAFGRAEWARTDSPRFNRTFSHAVEWFKAQFAAARIDVCLLFSDARPFSVAAHTAAQELGVVCLFFERGAFRDRTSSLSTQGLNARFDLNRARQCQRIDGLPEAAVPARRPPEPWLKTRFVGFMLDNALACAVSPGRDLMQHKRYHFFNYVRLGWKQLMSGQRERRAQRENASDSAGAPTVLLPLQLQTDSQFVMHSPFRHNQELLDFVVPRVRAQIPNGVVLVKKHPMDVRGYRLPPGARFVDGNLARFIPAAAMVVCLNSNVGFEAAIHGKTVLCFGDSFYTGHEQVVRVTRDDFSERIKHAASRRDDSAAGHALKSAVLRYYQSPGDVWAYTDEDIAAATEIVIQHVGAAGLALSRAEARNWAAPAVRAVESDRAIA